MPPNVYKCCSENEFCLVVADVKPVELASVSDGDFAKP